MIFDKLCGIAERHLPDLVPILEKTQIFVFEGAAHKELVGAYNDRTDEEIQDIFDNFFLPFPNIAIEDKASCIILIDTVDEQTGLHGLRLFLEILPSHSDYDEYFSTGKDFTEEEKDLLRELEQDGVVSLILGRVECIDFKRDNMRVIGQVNMYYVGNKENIVDHSHLIKSYEKFITDNSLQNVIAAYHEIIYFNRPNRFVLRESPVKEPKIKKGRLLRSHQRSLYTLLKPEEIRRKLGFSSDANASGRTVIKHRRQRHRRYLSSHIYKYDRNGNEIPQKIIPDGNRKGQKYYKSIIVRDAWVGESEKVVGKKFYKVVYDR